MNKLIGLTVVLLIIFGVFIYMSSQKSQIFGISSSPTQQVAGAQTTSESNMDTNVIVNVIIKNKKITSSNASFKVTEGQMVVLKITSDQNGELHLHGYNKKVNLLKDKTVVLSFLATITGHFEYELEDSKTVLGAVDVYPR